MWLSVCARIIVSVVLLSTCIFAAVPSTDKWWSKTIFYQLLVDSYKDSNGDGLGDIAGITQNIAHLKSMSVGAMILSPLFVTSTDCKKQGIVDYRSIKAGYGSFDDLYGLLKQSRKIGIKVLLSLPLQSMSMDSNWFVLSENKTSGYENYFSWNNNNNGEPNIGVQSRDKDINMWTWSSIRNEYHKKLSEGAALNLKDSNLFNEIKDVMTFWLDQGVQGFKVDLDDSDKILYEMRVTEMGSLLNQISRSRGGDESILIVQTKSSPKRAMMYYGDTGYKGADLVSQDNFFSQLEKSFTARDMKYLIDTWLTFLPDDSIATWMTGDIGKERLATQFGNFKVDAMNTLALFLPGVAITNQGDEIGMENVKVIEDPSQCGDASVLETETPYLWDDTTSSGFSNNPKTWLPVATNFRFSNLKAQKKSGKSHFKMYQAMAQARQSSTLRDGDLTIKVVSINVLIAVRKLKGKETFVAVVNFGNNPQIVDITGLDLNEMMVYCATEQSSFNMGDKVNADNFKVAGGDTVVFMAPPNECSKEGPVTKITSKLNDAMRKINTFFGS